MLRPHYHGDVRAMLIVLLAAPFLRGGDDLVVPLETRRCDLAEYVGPQTLLYADRPYHTDAAVKQLEGLDFCRGKRHGQALWILRVTRPTRLYAIASERHELERDGWKLEEARVRVEAAGLVLDRLYAKSLSPGRYAIRYGRARTAHPIFWDGESAHVDD